MDKQPNKDYINQSLVNQIANLSMQIAQRDAVITEQQMELEEYRKKEIEEMDKGGEEMLKSNNGKTSMNLESGELMVRNATTTRVLTSKDEPCGKDTNFKYNHKPNAE